MELEEIVHEATVIQETFESLNTLDEAARVRVMNYLIDALEVVL